MEKKFYLKMESGELVKSIEITEANVKVAGTTDFTEAMSFEGNNGNASAHQIATWVHNESTYKPKVIEW